MTAQEKAAEWRDPAASKKTSSQTNNIPDASPAQDKAFAVFLYNSGISTFPETQGKFAKNPQWRTA